jgi:hypothetical protein
MYTEPVSYAATYLAKARGLWQPESFHGTAVFLGRGPSGEPIGMTDKQLADLRNQIDRSLTDGPPEPTSAVVNRPAGPAIAQWPRHGRRRITGCHRRSQYTPGPLPPRPTCVHAGDGASAGLSDQRPHGDR